MNQLIADRIGVPFDETKVATLVSKLDEMNALRQEIMTLQEEIKFVAPLGGEYGMGLTFTFANSPLGQSSVTYAVEFGQVTLEGDAISPFHEVNPSTIPAETFLKFFEVKQEVENVMSTNNIGQTVL